VSALTVIIHKFSETIQTVSEIDVVYEALDGLSPGLSELLKESKGLTI
jgi:hypothetical protein